MTEIRRPVAPAASWGALGFPTPLHEQVADAVASWSSAVCDVDTVLIVNSCARGRATRDSDLDVAVLLRVGTDREDLMQLEALWDAHRSTESLIATFEGTNRSRPVHLDFFDGRFTPTVWDDGGGPDGFEVEIGNRVAHAVPLHGEGARFRELRECWLPYYPDELQRMRLQMARAACLHDLDRIGPLVTRNEGFSALAYLNKAFQEFLQALFIARAVYPLSYSKWLREQVAERLGLPELYRELAPILSVSDIESQDLAGNALALRHLLERWVLSNPQTTC